MFLQLISAPCWSGVMDKPPAGPYFQKQLRLYEKSDFPIWVHCPSVFLSTCLSEPQHNSRSSQFWHVRSTCLSPPLQCSLNTHSDHNACSPDVSAVKNVSGACATTEPALQSGCYTSCLCLLISLPSACEPPAIPPSTAMHRGEKRLLIIHLYSSLFHSHSFHT